MLFLLVFIIVTVFYLYTTRNHSYWAKRKVKHDTPSPIFGNHFRTSFGSKSITQISIELYNKYSNEKVVGYYRGNTPELIIRDPDLVKHILNVDFTHFHRRGLGRNPDTETLMLSLFRVDGDKWKLLRQRLTAAFTTSKLKSMFPLVVQCAEKLQRVAAELAVREEEYDLRELMARFTTEFISACGFGIEVDTINNETSQFRKLGKIIFSPNITIFMLEVLSDLFPEVTKHFHMGNKDEEKCIVDLFINIRKQRNGKPIGRNDFIDILFDLEAKGKIIGESIEKNNSDGSPVHVEMELNTKCMAAQVKTFFAAGFETSSSATSFTLHQLAYNLDVQSRVQEEIDRVMIKYDNKLCYEAIEEMFLLDMAFKEAMRIFPSLGVLNRVCVKKCTLPGLDFSIDAGVKILIPIQAIQNDKTYFDEPTEYRPERFIREAVKERHKFVYLPFGEGPRGCIAERLGHMQSLAGLAAVLHRFTVEPSASSTKQLQVNPYSNIVQGLSNGIPLMIKERKNKSV